MKQKIIFWLDADLTSYCLAYYLQQRIDAEFYAIIDITNRAKEFFLNQKIVTFPTVAPAARGFSSSILRPLRAVGSISSQN